MALDREAQELLNWFKYDHLPDGPIKGMSRDFGEFANDLALACSANDVNHPQVAVGLQRLMEAKDCFVRAVVATVEGTSDSGALHQGTHDPQPILIADEVDAFVGRQEEQPKAQRYLVDPRRFAIGGPGIHGSDLARLAQEDGSGVVKQEPLASPQPQSTDRRFRRVQCPVNCTGCDADPCCWTMTDLAALQGKPCKCKESQEAYNATSPGLLNDIAP